MRNTLLSWLPDDLKGCQVLDAGCGTGVISIELAKRGAEVIAVDLSQSLIDLANERYSTMDEYHRIQFIVGDMRQVEGERFDHVLAMDSIIHYAAQDGLRTLETLADSVDQSMVFTFAPRTLPLAAMHAVGKFFPRSDRAPAIEPIAPSALMKSLGNSKALTDWHVGREHRVSTGFYTSQAMELVRAC
jgi:magnesium-protoporphyrin O-methyltransferase